MQPFPSEKGRIFTIKNLGQTDDGSRSLPSIHRQSVASEAKMTPDKIEKKKGLQLAVLCLPANKNLIPNGLDWSKKKRIMSKVLGIHIKNKFVKFIPLIYILRHWWKLIVFFVLLTS